MPFLVFEKGGKTILIFEERRGQGDFFGTETSRKSGLGILYILPLLVNLIKSEYTFIAAI